MSKRSLFDRVIPCPNCAMQMDAGHIESAERWVEDATGRKGGQEASASPAFRVEVFRCRGCGTLLHLAREKAE